MGRDVLGKARKSLPAWRAVCLLSHQTIWRLSGLLCIPSLMPAAPNDHERPGGRYSLFVVPTLLGSTENSGAVYHGLCVREMGRAVQLGQT